MIIASDTTSFRYLIEIDAVNILAILFGQVIIPEAVARELQHPKTPQKVKSWIQVLPSSLEIRKADSSYFAPREQIGLSETKATDLSSLGCCSAEANDFSSHTTTLSELAR